MPLLLYNSSEAQAGNTQGLIEAEPENGCFTGLSKFAQSSWVLETVF